MSVTTRLRRFLARDKRQYELLVAERKQRTALWRRKTDQRLEEGHPSAEAVKQSLWIP